MKANVYPIGDSLLRHLVAACAIALLATGCFKKDAADDGEPTGEDPPAVNQAPTISGTPPASIVVGQAYSFQPTASDPDGDALTFSIQNLPTWASFNASNGRLSGTPGAGDAGQFIDVRISVSDGRAQAALGPFAITVNQIAMGSVTLSWSPPTTNADGSTITDLAGYRIYYGTSSGALDEMVVISNSGTTRWVVDNLSPATWYFTMTSYNTAGIESSRTTVVSRTLT